MKLKISIFYRRKMTLTEERTICQTCRRIIAKPKKGLSSVLYRQIVRDISSKETANNVKGKLIQIIQHGNAEFSCRFAQDLDEKIASTSCEEIKKWLLEQLTIINMDSGEKALYQHIASKYPDGIDELFTTFYENYVNWLHQKEGQPMTKNFVSRALGTIGLKAKMIRVDFEGRKKSAMVLRVSKDELCQLLQDPINPYN